MQLDRDGAQLYPAALGAAGIAALTDLLSTHAENARLGPALGLANLIAPADAIAASVLGPRARPVRAIFFDKSRDRNWALGWHQDRTIAVRERVEAPGFTDWTVKSGIHHCVPPFGYLERTLTLRLHLDDTGVDNAPLLIAPGTHRLGRIAEPEIPQAVERHGTDTCLAKAGDIWAYSTPILHASDRAGTPLRRRVLQILYSAEVLGGGLEWLGV
ncbi:phytanoyl-CoA dioxygenase family protein [Allosphingosinicella sp.]|jgi:hypothetical protein|uniref:phytanoyl-CoA dioxygenase family protein n=1 Tax=Allosphingosinicella sp. TaxID=2823234 RepID=UPI002EEF9237